MRGLQAGPAVTPHKKCSPAVRIGLFPNWRAVL